MRYRPFGRSQLALSTLGLELCPHTQKTDHIVKLIKAGLECGINAYFFKSLHQKTLIQAAKEFSIVERKILFIGALGYETDQGISGFSMEPAQLRQRLKWAVRDCGLDYLDFLAFDNPHPNYLPEDSMDLLDRLRQSQLIKHLAAIVETNEMLDLIHSPEFSIIMTSFNINSDWAKRNAIDKSLLSNKSIFSLNHFPEAIHKKSDVAPKTETGLFNIFAKKSPLAGSGTYAFLHQTPEWTAEELCLAYVLSQPTLSCVWINPDSVDEIYQLAEIPERHMPPSVPAQIEMARFSSQDDKIHQKIEQTSKLSLRS